jgi:hypothetical protein
VKKQINPSINAHLLWSALILLSLLAVCAIPFALAQQNAAKPSASKPATQPISAAKMYPPQNAPPSTGAAIAHQPAYQGESTSRSDVPFLKPQTALVPERPAVCTLNGTLGTAPPAGDTGTLATRIFRPGTPTVMCGVAPTWPGNIETGPFIYNVHYITNSGGSPLCTTVTLHVVTEGTAVTNMQCSAFMAPFAAGDITNQARYLGDAGVSSGNPPVDTTFQLTVPASTTIALVVLNVNASPAGQGTVYQVMLNQDIFCQQATPSPTATGTPTPSPTATGTPTPSPTATGTPTPACASYEAESGTLAGSAVVQSCPTCSGGHKVGYVGNNSGTLQFNGVSANATGRYVVTIWYTNGDAVRYALLSVNGSPGTPVSFPSTGSFQTVGSIQRTITLNFGSNTLKFDNPISGNWAPDFDRLGVNCTITPTPIPSPTPTATPTATPTPSVTPGAARAVVADFNGDGHPDWVLRNAGSRQTAIWYMNNNVFIGGAFGPTLAAGWGLRGAADFNSDGHPDYPLFAPNTRQTGIWYLSGPMFIGGAFGPTLPGGWALVTTADFNADAKPDNVLYNAGTRQTAIWYMNNNVFMSGAYGPTLPVGWSLVGVADFNGDGHPDYALFNSSTRQTAIWYLSGPTRIGTANGPTVPTGWALVATADFNGDGKPDYVLYKAGTRQTAIWYMNNNLFVSGAFGPTLPAGWSLVGQ